jgi:hypothetical protein
VGGVSWRARGTDGRILEFSYDPRRRRWGAWLVDPETGRRLRALRVVMVSVTFSVETRAGKEPPVVEITACTNVPPMSRRARDRVVRRVANAVVKLLWLMFDLRKEAAPLPQDAYAALERVVPFALLSIHDERLRGLWPQYRYREVEAAGRRYYEVHLGVMSERRMDRALWLADQLLRTIGRRLLWRCREEVVEGRVVRDCGEYFAHQSVIKVGVEVGPREPRCPRWPYVRVYMHLRNVKEGVVVRERAWVATILIRRRTPYDMLRRLGIELEMGGGWE